MLNLLTSLMQSYIILFNLWNASPHNALSCIGPQFSVVCAERHTGPYGDLYRVRDVTKPQRLFGLTLIEAKDSGFNFSTAIFLR